MQSPGQFEDPLRPAQQRRGCFRGCLLGCLPQVFGVLSLALLGMMALLALLAPYTYYYGGHFHIVPGWQGQGWIHDPAAGGDFFLWLNIEPTTPGYRKSDLKGVAYLCSPKGERFRLTMGGSLPKSRPTNTIGAPLHVYLHYRPIIGTAPTDRRPSLDFYGAFGDRRLELEDRGSLATAFRPDGTLYALHDPNRPWSNEHVAFTLNESHGWFVAPACPGGP